MHEDLLLSKSGQTTNFVREFVFRLYGLQSTSVFESDFPETVLRAAESGMGIAVITDTVPYGGRALRAIPVLDHGRQVETQVVVELAQRAGAVRWANGSSLF